MKNIGLIYNRIDAVKVNIKNPNIIIDVNRDEINSETLVYIASRFKYIRRCKFLKKTIVLRFKNIRFSDKITYLILEALIYDLIKYSQMDFGVYYDDPCSSVHSVGFGETPIMRTRNIESGIVDKKEFIKEFEKHYFSNEYVFRKLITREELNNNETPSIIVSEVAFVLKANFKDEDWIDSISEVISELICNISSHTDGDCLLDIDFRKVNYKNSDSETEKLSSLNIGVINFSENRLFDRIKGNLVNNKYDKEDPLYKKIYEAYDTHSKEFDSYYDDDAFYLVTSFQNRVTSRSLKSGNSGTGLTTIIQNIIGKTKGNYSYVLSGDSILFFNKDYLYVSNEKFIGFNAENDYFKYRPAKEVISKTKLFIPGTVYQLLLIKE